MYARVITFMIKPGTADEVAKRAEKSAVPWLTGQKGFHGMHMIKVGDAEMIAFEVWEDKATFDASRQGVEQQIQQIIGDLLTAPASIVEGEQMAHARGQESHHGQCTHMHTC